MPELTELLERADRALRESMPLPATGFEGILRRRDQRRRNQRIRAGVLGAAVALAVALTGARALLTEPVPVDTPTPPPASPSGSDDDVDDGPALYLVDPATGETELILEAAGGLDEPEYAPDDSRLVYHGKDDNGIEQIFVLDDGRKRQLTHLSGGAFEPTWSPDGTQIAFAARSDEGDGGRSDTDIFVMDADGSDVRNVAGTEWNDGHPDWSPDGSRIVFHDVRAHPSAGITSGIMWGRIWVVSLDDAEVALLEQAGPPYWSGADPAWTPDGRSIVYTRLPGSSINGRMPYAPLWVMRSDGSGQRPLVGSSKKRFAECRFDASWSPDGSAIAFTEDGHQNLGIIDVQRGVVAYVTLSTPVANLSWGTDGIVASVGRDVAPMSGFGCYNS